MKRWLNRLKVLTILGLLLAVPGSVGAKGNPKMNALTAQVVELQARRTSCRTS